MMNFQPDAALDKQPTQQEPITHDDIINAEIEQEHAEKDIRDAIIEEAIDALNL